VIRICARHRERQSAFLPAAYVLKAQQMASVRRNWPSVNEVIVVLPFVVPAQACRRAGSAIHFLPRTHAAVHSLFESCDGAPLDRKKLRPARLKTKAPLQRGFRHSARVQTATQNGSLTQLQCGDLVRRHHGVPGVGVGGDGDPEWAAAPDHLALGDDAGVGDPGGVAFGLLSEPHGAVG
jgi:hypothetical protein